MKLIRKEKHSNGTRKIYFCGVQVYHYKRKEKSTVPVKESSPTLSYNEQYRLAMVCTHKYFEREWDYGKINGTYLFPSDELSAIPEAPLSLPHTESPLVSIIIPAHNRIDLNLQCIRSIIKNSGNVDYEIILADDCSSDETSHIEDYVTNIRRITTPENMLFLKNCNHAATFARGKYVLFLNNDTIVQHNWLQPLVDTMEDDETVGLCGSKLIFANGKLQEAGGIIYRDASGNNFGRGDSPEYPQYNYLRETDYISGAAIMLRRQIWEKAGGFDTYFSPAYYEDTDLAFRIRYTYGLKVVYQPRSVVMHLEGESNGTDLTAGIKKYQVVNRIKFFQRWQEELNMHHATNSPHNFLAREHAIGKKVILVIDWGMLTPDKDTGSRVTWQYMLHWKSKGYIIKYFPHETVRDKQRMQTHLEAGIEVICESLADWLEYNGRYVDFIYLNRPAVAELHMQELRRYTKARIIYQGHDLHYLRQYRARILENDSEAEELLQTEKLHELRLCAEADAACYFSQFEIDTILKENPFIQAVTVPLFVLDPKKMDDIVYKAESRKDIIFVAGFKHPVNIDAAVWFCKEVFPSVKKQIPDIKLYIIGSYPTEEVLALASDSIIVTGTVSEERLIQYYREARLTVVPLRAGAGVKGKVIESIFNKVPLITTSIGAEGIANPDNNFIIADDAPLLAEKIVALYPDFEQLNVMASKCTSYIETYFSAKCVDKVFSRFGI